MHTPGPWTKDRNRIIDRNGEEIARVSYGQSGFVQANARLIAAAPELLEALRAFVKARDMVGWSEGECDLWLGPAWEAARAAIDKAGG